jgi:hypothetical protein
MTIIRWMRRTTTGRCRIWVRLRRTRPEQMSSGLPLKADIAQYGQLVSKVPTAEVNALIRSPRRRWREAFLRGRAVLGGVGAFGGPH